MRASVERQAVGAKLIDAFGDVKGELALDVAIDPSVAKCVQQSSEPGHTLVLDVTRVDA